MATVKRVNRCRVSPNKRAALKRAKTKKDLAAAGTGIDGAAGVRVQPTFVPKTGRKVIQGPDNAAAVVLDNNPLYADGGGDFAARIAVVAGLGGHRLGESDKVEELTPLNDAAGVYIVQKDDPQDVLGSEVVLANPAFATVGNMQEIPDSMRKDKVKSHVTAYADTVQLVARNGGINLYAGGVDSEMSTGTPNTEYLGVNLIYGNKIEYELDESPYSLQPMVKGHNVEQALRRSYAQIEELSGIVFNMQLQMVSLEIALALHTHPAALFWTLPSVELLITGAARAPTHIFNVLGSVTNTINNVVAEINQSSITSAGIKSRWHKLN